MWGAGGVLPGRSRTLKVCQADLPPAPMGTEEPWAEEAGPMEGGHRSRDAKDLGVSTGLCSPPSFTITGPSQSPWSASFGVFSSSRAQPSLGSYKGSCGGYRDLDHQTTLTPGTDQPQCPLPRHQPRDLHGQKSTGAKR